MGLELVKINRETGEITEIGIKDISEKPFNIKDRLLFIKYIYKYGIFYKDEYVVGRKYCTELKNERDKNSLRQKIKELETRVKKLEANFQLV